MRGPAQTALHVCIVAFVMAMAFVARYGTGLARALAIAGCALGVLAGVVFWLIRGRARSDLRRLVREVILPADAEVGARALRAAGLVDRLSSETGGLSRQLAQVHLERLVERASVEEVKRAAQRRARLYVWTYAAVGLGIFGVATFASRELFEGFDVLIARGSRAPVPMPWTERLRVIAQPPVYLRAPPRRIMSGSLTTLPKGTQLTLRARPLHPGRALVVSDGEREFPFVSDGDGGVVAHYPVDRDVSLVIAARFGDVLIVEPESIEITALTDEAPVVELEGAPSSLRLSELTRLELRWAAVDDHGVRQVDLVLRSGTREERRVLGTYDDAAPQQSGAYVLLPTDPFLRSLYLPARVTIEAKDNDPVDGSKWGGSAAYEIVPTAVGEPDAQRYLALTRARDGFVDALAVATVPPAGGEELFEQRLGRAVADLRRALSDSYGGLRVPQGLRSFALGRLRVLEEQSGSAQARAPMLGETILAIDAALASLATRDAQRVAKVLAEVAEEAMVGAGQARSLEGQREIGIERLDRAIVALHAGAEQLLALGTLGHDLGSVALADLGRVERGREQEDFFHAELAARHLADRLRRPVPSFGAQGSGSSGGGVEAGQGESSEPSGEASNAQEEFDELAWQIAELAREHGGAVRRVDRALSEAEARLDHEALRGEAERRASELRDAVSGFPVPGHSPETAEASAALAAEHARAMAHNLESLRLDQAVESGRRAASALREAAERAREGSGLDAELEHARAVLEEQLRWASTELEAAREAAKQGAKEELQEPAVREEQLAEAAERLARRGENEATPLPREVTERLRRADRLMRQAARELREGNGEGGLSLQREAQRLLEDADQGTTHDTREGTDEENQPGEGDGSDGPPRFDGDVPEAEEQNKAEEFRRRVLESLGESPDGRLGPAIRRYAEGLLR